MNRFCRNLGVAGLMLMLLPLSSFAQSSMDELPPLIDRQIFFGDPEIVGAQLSPDGTYMSFLKPYQGMRNIWVKPVDAPFQDAEPITADTERPINGYAWSRDGRYVLYVQDKGGDENFHVYIVDPKGERTAEGDVPEARNVTPYDGARAIITSVPRNDHNSLIVGLNDRDPAWHDLYRINLTTGERTLIRQNESQITGWVFDLEDNLRLATRVGDDGSTEVLRVDDDSFDVIYTCSVYETCGPNRFHKDGERVYMTTNKGDDVDLMRLVLFNPETLEETLVESDPEGEVDLGNAVFSQVTDELVATAYLGDRQRIYWKDEAFEADYNYLKSELPNVDINLGSSTDDERLWIIGANSDVDPGATYLFNRDTRELTFQYRPRPELPIEDLAPMQPVRYTSLDGLEIPAYLTLPRGVEPKNLPTIMYIHGGPWARDTWGYDGYAQFLANRGYAVLQPNFRGSTGYGKAFLNAGNGEWGDAMQDDITAGVQYLIDEGIADPERVGIFGGSYGGYATLAGLTFTPDVYAAGVSIVGPSSISTLLNSIPPYWAAARQMFNERVGDPDDPEDAARLKRQSPLHSADKIQSPLLVVQGANDPRVKQAESDQIVVAMRELGLPVEYIVAPDEGHGFARPVNNMAFVASAERFLSEHLGGRYQDTMTEEVDQRLREITVDIFSVEMPQTVDDATATAALPKPTKSLTASKALYAVNISVNGQDIAMQTTQEITQDDDGLWHVIESAQSPMGSIVDSVRLAEPDLLPVARRINQGPMTIAINHSADKIDGEMNMNGQTMPIDVAIDAPVFADGAGLNAVMPLLPLAEGYKATYRVFDASAQRVKLMQLNVEATETIEVPAGSFETYKVVLEALDGSPGGTTLWVDTQGTRIIKSTASLPQMGGAILTSELSSIGD